MSQKPYWITTSVLAAGMIVAGVQELRHAPDLLEGARRLGYPDYLLTLLGTAQLVGAPLLLVPRFAILFQSLRNDPPRSQTIGADDKDESHRRRSGGTSRTGVQLV